MGYAEWRSLQLALDAGAKILRLLHRAHSPPTHLDSLVSASRHPSALRSTLPTRTTLRSGATLCRRLSYRTSARSRHGRAQHRRTARTGWLSSRLLLTCRLSEGRRGAGDTTAVDESLSERGRYHASYTGAQTVS